MYVLGYRYLGIFRKYLFAAKTNLHLNGNVHVQCAKVGVGGTHC